MSSVQSNKTYVRNVLHRLVDRYIEEAEEAEDPDLLNELPLSDRVTDFQVWLQYTIPYGQWLTDVEITGTQEGLPVREYIGLCHRDWQEVMESVEDINQINYDAIKHMIEQEEAENELLHCVLINQIMDQMNRQR